MGVPPAPFPGFLKQEVSEGVKCSHQNNLKNNNLASGWRAGNLNWPILGSAGSMPKICPLKQDICFRHARCQNELLPIVINVPLVTPWVLAFAGAWFNLQIFVLNSCTSLEFAITLETFHFWHTVPIRIVKAESSLSRPSFASFKCSWFVHFFKKFIAEAKIAIHEIGYIFLVNIDDGHSGNIKSYKILLTC